MRTYFPSRRRRGDRQCRHARRWTGFVGFCEREHRGATCPKNSGRGRRCSADFNRWSSDGTLAAVLARLKERFSRDDLFDHSLWSIDGTIVRAHRCAGGGGKKGSERTRGPRSRAFSRGIFDETPCDLRWRRPAVERRLESGANARNATLRRVVEDHRSDRPDIETPHPTGGPGRRRDIVRPKSSTN